MFNLHLLKKKSIFVEQQKIKHSLSMLLSGLVFGSDDQITQLTKNSFNIC